ncbi:MAG: 23S rRNA (pseudouridine(1915)-N(3))-methyltransferase RlmH [Flavobacteriales bacterium]|nr:23S rRNA (pseudouridine(1915)-N(3))-methyltransferase RlmH [Flavobacteriales bacterium]
MKINLLCVGKTNSNEIIQLIKELEKRIPNYINFEIIEIPDIKNAKKNSPNQIKDAEAESILSKLDSSDYLVLLDEKGKQYKSTEFANYLQQKMNQSIKKMVFCIGGAYGFSEKMYLRANEKISLSKMTFTHQMIRLFFVEQLYRGFSIIEGKPYHNE